MTDVWPIKGHILLRGSKPIASFQSIGEAYAAVQLYCKSELGQDFSLLSADGWMTQRNDPAPEKEESAEEPNQ